MAYYCKGYKGFLQCIVVEYPNKDFMAFQKDENIALVTHYPTDTPHFATFL